MDIQKKENLNNNYLFNNKFKNLLRNQPIDNLFIKSNIPLKIVKSINYHIISIKKRKLYSDKIMIDNKYSLNYQNKNDLKVYEYLNYLINKGIIIQQDNSSQKYILKESNTIINSNTNIKSNIISNINTKVNTNINKKTNIKTSINETFII